MVRNIVLASAVALILVVSASQPVQALTAAEIQTQIQQLVARVVELTAQLNALRSSSTSYPPSTPVASYPGLTKRICAISLRPFVMGEQSDDVRAFQEFLRGEGYFDREPTGYFGGITRSWLARWQAAQGLEGVGFVGPKTMERIRIWCGGVKNDGLFSVTPERGAAPLTVTFKSMVGGFRPANVSYSIDFGDGMSERASECSAPADACVSPGTNTHTYTSNGTYTATLNKITDPCPDDGDPNTPRCLAAVQSEVIGKVQIHVGSGAVACTTEYKPVCGAKQVVCITTPCNPIPTTYSNKCGMEADGASFLYEGQCRDTSNPADDSRCKAWYDGCNSCARETPGSPAMCTLKYCAAPGKAYCTASFDGAGNKPPTISSFSGPTTLGVNTTGTWTVNASDPEGGTLSYQVSWGDEAPYWTYNLVSGAARAFVQSTTFTHVYTKAGTYTVAVTVQDANGQQAKTSTTVQVGDSPAACTKEYKPVCGRPQGCANTCAPGMACPAICLLHVPQTYGNRCALNAAGAEFLYGGECFDSSGLQQCPHDPYCKCDSAGRTVLCQ